MAPAMLSSCLIIPKRNRVICSIWLIRQEEKTNFKYDNGKLIRVKYPDGKEDTYAYDADEALTQSKRLQPVIH